MTAPRSRKESRTYGKYRKKLHPEACDFCDVQAGDPQFISETANFKVIRNIFPYSMWDGQRVADHLMVLPRQHTDTLQDLTPRQAQEFVQLISAYEGKGYNVYARAPTSRIKTVVHQHTHLIKPSGPVRKLVFMIRRPYMRISF
jgi:diadenosine tetraphosphate (Ap4A) HIT family hydrolase